MTPSNDSITLSLLKNARTRVNGKVRDESVSIPSAGTLFYVAEELPIEQAIHALLQQTQQASETVQELAFDCLRRFRQDCGSAIEQHQRDLAGAMLSTGEEDGAWRDDLASARDERIVEARKLLKERLENLLKTASEKKL